MSDYVKTKISLMDEVSDLEVRNRPDKTVIVVSLYATYTDEDVENVKSKAKKLGYYFDSYTSLRGSYALKFTKPDKKNHW